MKTINVRIISFGGGKYKKKLILKSFLLLRKNVFKVHFVPPFKILNEYFMSGSSQADSGDIIEWKPFKIPRIEYDELMARIGPEFIFPARFPKNIRTLDDWIDFSIGYREKNPYKRTAQRAV